MATPIETFALVLMDGCGADSDIKRVIRTYLTKPRAEQDWDLMQKTDPLNTYRVIDIEHIDD